MIRKNSWGLDSQERKLSVISIISIVILLVLLPFVLRSARSRIFDRSSATAATALGFSAPQQQIGINQSFTQDVIIHPGANLVSYINLVVTYDSAYLAPDGTFITPNTQVFAQTLDGPTQPNCTGTMCSVTISLSIGNDPTKAIAKTAVAATVHLKAIAQGSSQISFDSATQVLSIGPSDQSNENVLATSQPATIVIGPTDVSPTPTGGPLPTDSPISPLPSEGATPSGMPSPTRSPFDRSLSLSVGLPGIGIDGGNTTPIHNSKPATIFLVNQRSNTVSTHTGTVTFDGNKFFTNAAFDVKRNPPTNPQPSGRPTGMGGSRGQFCQNNPQLCTNGMPDDNKIQQYCQMNPDKCTNGRPGGGGPGGGGSGGGQALYTGYLAIHGYLTKKIPTDISFASSSAVVLPPITLVAADIAPDNPDGTFGDDKLDLLDYNALVNCYGVKADTPTCIDKAATDIDDNGVIDGIDYNILLRSFGGGMTTGQKPPQQSPSQSPNPTQPISVTSQPTNGISPMPTNGTSPTAMPQSPNTITIKDDGFYPFGTGVLQGATVTWINQGTMPHTVSYPMQDLGDINEGDIWDSQTIPPGEKFQHTFTKTGDYSYYCKTHPTMRGYIYVTDNATELTPIPTIESQSIH